MSMRWAVTLTYLWIILFSILPATTTVYSGVVEQDNTIAVDNGWIKIIWDLEHGGAIKNIYAICKDFKNYPVAKKGISAIRGGGGMPAIETVLWDLLTTGDPWYGPAVTTSAQYRVVEETENYTIIEISYTTGDPLPGLKVVKTYKIYNASFVIDFNVTLANEGSSSLSIDVSDAWGRPSGPMFEMVAAMGEPSDEMRFIMYENGTIETFEPSVSWLAYAVNSTMKGFGIYDQTTSVSPWGFMFAVFMIDNETVSKTSYVWFEQNAGGSPNEVIRVEYAPVTLNPGESVEYHMKIYAGPIYYDFLKPLGISKSEFDKNFYTPELSLRRPCTVLKIKLKYSVNVNLETTGGTSIPKASLMLLDPYTGDIYNQYEINSSSFVFKMPYTNATYTLKVVPTSGITLDGLGEFEFIGFILPNGTEVDKPEINVTLNQGDTIKLKFKIKPLAKLMLLFLTPDMVDLPQQAGDINVSVFTALGELLFSATSTPGQRNITVTDNRESPPRPGLTVPDTYVIKVPVKAGIYSLDKVLLNNKPVSYQVVGEYAQITITLEQGGMYELKIIYSTGGISGGGGGLLVWIVIIAVLVIVILLAFLKKKK